MSAVFSRILGEEKSELSSTQSSYLAIPTELPVTVDHVNVGVLSYIVVPAAGEDFAGADGPSVPILHLVSAAVGADSALVALSRAME